MVLEKTLANPLDCKEIQPVHPKGDQSGCSLEALMLLLSHIQGYHCHLSNCHIYALVYCIGVFLSGLLHSIISSSFIHLIRTDSNVFFLMAAAAAAAAAAASRQSCPTLCDPIDGSPTGSPVPGILQARTLEWVAISFSNA